MAAPNERKPRRFVPEPGEGTSPVRKPRRFAPEPVESSTHHHTPSNQDSSPSIHSNEKEPSSEEKHTSKPVSRSSSVTDGESASDTSSSKPRRRRFAPQLVDTVSRSRKNSDSGPTLRPEDRTNASPDDPPSKPKRRDLSTLEAPANTPTQTTIDGTNGFKPPPPLRQGSMRAHHNTRVNTRQPSFKVPSLSAIESSGSEDSVRAQENDKNRSGAARRESEDDQFSGYLLALAARAAEKQLREQEIAVFPAADIHERVDHYVDDRDSSGEERSKSRSREHRPARRQTAEDNAELRAMQQHARKKQEATNTTKGTSKREKAAGAFNIEFDKTGAYQSAWMSTEAPRRMIGGHQQDPDLRQMRKAASPPMLGGDIEFPRCPSPEHARFDVTQGPEFLKNTVGNAGNFEGDGRDAGLWGAAMNEQQCPASPNYLTPQVSRSSQPPKQGPAGGLWGGFCTGGDAGAFNEPIGIVTPRRTPANERDDPFQHGSSSSIDAVMLAKTIPRDARPPSPPSSFSSQATDLHMVSSASRTEQKLAAEFPDEFVTQVYNYLSLGFPVMAWRFDEELSKITGTSVEELREDDKLAEQMGYLRLGEGELTKDEVGVDETMCKRWLALRAYCREWGRQMGVCDEESPVHSNKLSPHRAWGIPGRKGSWGL